MALYKLQKLSIQDLGKYSKYNIYLLLLIGPWLENGIRLIQSVGGVKLQINSFKDSSVCDRVKLYFRQFCSTLSNATSFAIPNLERLTHILEDVLSRI